jgi:NADPH:quinone reductase-like Zn-dependent oxidoreductase
MKAVIVKKYGGPEVAHVAEIPTPRITKPNQILVRVMASTVNSGDARLRRADPWFVRFVFGLRGPRRPVLGAVFAGVVEAVGKDVTTYRVGGPSVRYAGEFHWFPCRIHMYQGHDSAG